MLSVEKIFGNLFDTDRITNSRLSNFAQDSINRFKNISSGGKYDAVIASLTAAHDALAEEMNMVDSGLSSRKVKTINLKEFVASLKSTMGEVEGAFAFHTGGKRSEAFLELYPHGQKEYRMATKEAMPTLVGRIKTVTDKYGPLLPATLLAKLDSFHTNWHTLLAAQEKVTSSVKNSRAGRNGARHNLELALQKAIYTVALEYTFDIEQCCRFFDFNLLQNVKRHRKKLEE